jgi:hypothetical protein
MTNPVPLRIVLAGALATLAALMVTACGGHTVNKQDVIARGNAICAAAQRDLLVTPSPGGETSLPGLGAYLRAVMPILQREVSNLQALPRPAADRALLNQYVAAVTKSGTTYRALAAAAGHGDQDGVNQALAELQVNPASSLAARYGLNQCAGATGTAVPR